MAVVITSTTSSQAELDHATSENWREPFVKPEPAAAPAKEPEAAVEAEVEQPEVAEKPEPEVDAKPEPKQKKGGVDKRIDNLTKARREAEIARDTERARAERLEHELAVLRGEAPKQVPDREPNWKEFQDQGKSIEEFLATRDAWRDVQAIKEEQRNKYNEAMEAGKAKYKDWETAQKEADASGITLPPDVVEAARKALAEEDNKQDVLYYLWKHPDDSRKMITMNPAQTERFIAKLAERLSMTSDGNAPAPKPKVQPPPPIEPVTNASSRGEISLDKLSPREYINIRNKQERERRRG